MDDGTASLRPYDRVDGVLGRGIQVSGLFQTTVNELVLSVPTPSPVPAVVNLTRDYDLAHAINVSPKAESPTTAFSPDAFVVAVVAAALDADMPAHRATQPNLKTMVTFTFGSHRWPHVRRRHRDADRGPAGPRTRRSRARAIAATSDRPIPELPCCVSV